MKRFYLLIICVVLAILPLTVASAQDDDAAVITLTGTVTIIDETTIEVGGLTVNIESVTNVSFVDGMIVTISGTLDGAIIMPITIIVETDPEATPDPEITPEPEVTPEVTPEPESTPEAGEPNVIFIIEGPVQTIEVNIVTIYGFTVELDVQDQRTNVVQIGDVLRVRGFQRGIRARSIVIVATTFIFVNVDVILVDGQLWRDYGDCGVVPPPWAEALAINWRNRCEANIIIVPGVPNGCRVTGMGGIRCTNRGSRGSRGS